MVRGCLSGSALFHLPPGRISDRPLREAQTRYRVPAAVRRPALGGIPPTRPLWPAGICAEAGRFHRSRRHLAQGDHTVSRRTRGYNPRKHNRFREAGIDSLLSRPHRLRLTRPSGGRRITFHVPPQCTAASRQPDWLVNLGFVAPYSMALRGRLISPWQCPSQVYPRGYSPARNPDNPISIRIDMTPCMGVENHHGKLVDVVQW